MTTIVAALNRIARDVSIDAPSDWTAATADEHLELRDDFLLETVDDITDRVDWPAPISATSDLTGDDRSDGEYDLPADYKRMHRDGLAVYDVAQSTGCIPVTTAGEWESMIDLGATGAQKYYKTRGYDEGGFYITIYTAPAQSAVFKINYVTTKWMATSGGTAGSAFTDVGDVLLLPRRLVEVGTIARWRERKGLPFQDKAKEFEILLARYQNDNRGRRALNFGDAKPRKPWDVPVPSYIPAS